jgi:predicted transcriptional regulator
MSDDTRILELTTQIVSAHVGAHKSTPEEITALIAKVHTALSTVADTTAAESQDTPAVPISDSLRDDAIVCLEDGLEFQSLKRHLRVKYNLTPDAYRQKWGLPRDYPMVAPAYARRRSALAKRSGLGKSAK